jgi:hypothetical protein
MSQPKYNTFNSGYLGSHNDEGRSKMRYAMWIAGLYEPSEFWTQIALVYSVYKYVCLSVV